MTTQFSTRKPQQYSDVRWSRQQAWLDGLWLEYGVDRARLAEELRKLGKLGESKEEKNSNAYVWYKGKRQANENSVKRVNDLYPGSRDIYDYPVWKLLGLEVLRPKHIEKLKTEAFEGNYVPTIPGREIGPERFTALVNDSAPGLYSELGIHLWQLPAKLIGSRHWNSIEEIVDAISETGPHTILSPLIAIRQSQFEEGGIRSLLGELRLEQCAANFLTNPVFMYQLESPLFRNRVSLPTALLRVVEEASSNSPHDCRRRWRAIYRNIQAESSQQNPEI